MDRMVPGGAPREELCEEKCRLLREYDSATADFSRAVQVLHSRLGVLSREEYAKLKHFSEHSRLRSEQARLALERHVSEHKC
jgi:hypothetical protein